MNEEKKKAKSPLGTGKLGRPESRRSFTYFIHMYLDVQAKIKNFPSKTPNWHCRGQIVVWIIYEYPMARVIKAIKFVCSYSAETFCKSLPWYFSDSLRLCDDLAVLVYHCWRYYLLHTRKWVLDDDEGLAIPHSYRYSGHIKCTFFPQFCCVKPSAAARSS